MHQATTKWKHLAIIMQEMPSPNGLWHGTVDWIWLLKSISPNGRLSRDGGGWGLIVNPMLLKLICSGALCLCHQIFIKELPPATPSTAIRTLEADFADTWSGKKLFLRKTSCFWVFHGQTLRKMNTAILKCLFHLQFNQNLLDNRNLATIWQKRLKKKMDSDPKFKKDYTEFIEGISSIEMWKMLMDNQ